MRVLSYTHSYAQCATNVAMVNDQMDASVWQEDRLGSDLSLDQQQRMVAQGVERVEAGQLSTGNLLTDQLQG